MSQSLSWGITSDKEPKIVVIDAWTMKEAIDNYLTEWYPGAGELKAIQVIGSG